MIDTLDLEKVMSCVVLRCVVFFVSYAEIIIERLRDKKKIFRVLLLSRQIKIGGSGSFKNTDS